MMARDKKWLESKVRFAISSFLASSNSKEIIHDTASDPDQHRFAYEWARAFVAFLDDGTKVEVADAMLVPGFGDLNDTLREKIGMVVTLVVNDGTRTIERMYLAADPGERT